MLDQLTAGLFRGLSAARGERVFHPDGASFRAHFEPDPRPEELGESLLLRGEREAVVRFSRGVGLPRAAPDILGVAVKLLDVYGPDHDQDLALASSGRSPVGRRLLVPRRDFAGTVFSSILPYAAAGRRVVVLAAATGRRGPVPLEALVDASHGPMDLRLWLEPGDVTLGWLRLGPRLSAEASADVRFDPWHTGPGLRPVGLLNRLRRPTYAASQEGRDAPAAGIRRHLDR